MGKKKKASKRDGRGYQQGQPAAAPSGGGAVLRVNKPAQQHLDRLLSSASAAPGDQKDTVGSSYLPSDRFAHKIGTIYDRLVDFGFTDAQIEAAVVALKYDITLETALDWLCLNVDDLPALFVESTSAQNEEAKEDQTLTVIAASTPAGTAVKDAKEEETDQRQEQIMLPSAKERSVVSNEEKDSGLKRQVVSDEDKQRLLDRFQYEEVDDESMSDDGGNENYTLLEESEPSPTLTKPEQTLEERQLELTLAELREAEADYKDEATNYIRSKYEIKELDKKIKQLRQQVSGLQRKVDRQCAERAVDEEEDFVVVVDDVDCGQEEDDEMGFASMLFDQDVAPAPATVVSMTMTTETAVSTGNENDKEQSIQIPKGTIPKGWTGSTPIKALKDFCKRERITLPKYHKQPRNGCKLTVELNKLDHHTVEVEGRIEDYSDAQHHAATQMLYKVRPELPMYRIFPPYHRDLWKGWMDQKQQVLDNAAQEVKERRREKIDSLVRLVEESVASNGSSMPAPISAESVDELHRPVVLDSWDDDRESDLRDESTYATAGPTTVDMKLWREWKRRRETSAYKRMAKQRSELPIHSFRDTILDTVARNKVTVLHAETGAGKTTQFGQYLLEDAIMNQRGDQTSIICTQPRRVAAATVAERVAEEMAEDDVGGLVGYQIRLEARRSKETRLMFCTTGVILRRLVEDPTLKSVSHVLVDEVHERQWQIDILLVTLRNLLSGPRPDLKVILMSATLDAKLFCSFFHDAPLVSVPGRTFPVTAYHLEDLLEATGHIIEEDSRYALRSHHRSETSSLMVTTKGGEKRKETVFLDSQVSVDMSDDFVGYSDRTRRSMDRVDESVLNYDLIEDILDLILSEKRQNTQLLPPDGADLSKGSVLIFLPGIGEIRSLVERLESNRFFGSSTRFDIIPLHSSLASKDQRRAFRASPAGIRKIIVSTNIAETSVTIPDVVCVIDSGRVRELTYDKRTQTPRLLPTWISIASSKQRAGRSGRVQPGLCLKLFSSRTEKAVMKKVTAPELQRIPLEEVCLNILATGLAINCRQCLRQTPQPPSDEAIVAALDHLRDVGAVEVVSTSDERLTPLGKQLAKLPVNARVGKMLIYGALFKCIGSTLTIAATLSASQSVYLSFMSSNPRAKAAHKAFQHPQSDFSTMVNVFNAFLEAYNSGKASSFCRDNFLNYIALREIMDGRRQYADLLRSIGFLDQNLPLQKLSTANEFRSKEHEAVLHAVIFSAMYPNLAQVTKSSKGDYVLDQKGQMLEIRSTSVNAKIPGRPPSHWMTFHEKTGTLNRTNVSTTCFVDPLAIMLFSSSMQVKHEARKVFIDDWIELRVAAKTAVTVREIRKKLDMVLKSCIQETNASIAPEMLDGIVSLIANNASA